MFIHAGQLHTRNRPNPQPIRDDKGRALPSGEVFDRWDAQRAEGKHTKPTWLSSAIAMLCCSSPKTRS